MVTYGTRRFVLYHIKNDKRTKLTAELLGNALNKLIFKDKWLDLTVTELVNEAGIGRATFYRNFDAIEDVLKYQIDISMNKLFKTLYSQLSLLDFFYEYELYTMFFTYWTANDHIIKVLLQSDNKTLFYNSFNNFYNEKLNFIKSSLGIQDSHWSYFVVLRSTIFTNGLFEWIKRGKKESPEEISKILLFSFSELHMVKMSLPKRQSF